MRRYVVPFLEILFFIGLFVVVQGASLYAQSDEFRGSWGDVVAAVINRTTVTDTQPQSYPCDGTFISAQIDRYGRVDDTCVYGDSQSTRFARFNTNGIFRYAVAFPDQSLFYEVRGICPIPRCVYAADTDTFMQHRSLPYWQYGAEVYKGFSKKLEKRFDASTLSHYYTFRSSVTPDLIVQSGENPLSVAALAVSANGKWGLVELKGLGIVRVNLQDLSLKRVVAPGSEYGLFNDPIYELSVSDSGETIAVAGYRLSTDIVMIDETCGDYLVPSMGQYYSQYVIPCKKFNMDRYISLSGAYRVFEPRLNREGSQLRLAVQHADGKVERITINRDGPLPPGQSYFALGDSYTSGEGELKDNYYRLSSNRSPPKCHVSTRSYPFLLGDYWGVEANSIACSGARTADILGSTSYEGQAKQLAGLSLLSINQARTSALSEFDTGVVPQIDFVAKYQPDVVSVSVGGNDAGLVGKLTACLTPGTCEWVKDSDKKYATAVEIAASYDKVRQVIKELKRISPATKVFVVGYPQIIQTEGNTKCNVIISMLLDSQERQFIAESIRYLNQVLQAAAHAEGVAYANIESSLVHRQLCGSQDEKAMNGVRLGDDIAPIKFLQAFKVIGAESFHPTPLGHQLVAQSIFDQYSTKASIQACAGCDVPSTIPPLFWGAPPGEGVRHQIEDPAITKNSTRSGEEIKLTTASMTFAPGSEVEIELHSEPIKIATNRVNDEGGLATDIVVPQVSSGYHILHLLGTSPDGNPVDRYQVVAVNEVEHEGELSGNAPTGGTTPTIVEPRSTVIKQQKQENAAQGLFKQSAVLGWDDAKEFLGLPPSDHPNNQASLTPKGSVAAVLPSKDDEGRSLTGPVLFGALVVAGVVTVILIVIRYRNKRGSRLLSG